MRTCMRADVRTHMRMRLHGCEGAHARVRIYACMIIILSYYAGAVCAYLCGYVCADLYARTCMRTYMRTCL